MDKQFTPDEVIDALGGTSKVADLCEVSPSAVAQWRTSRNGIPKPQLRFLQAANPSTFKALSAAKAKAESSTPTPAATVTPHKLTGEVA